MRLKRESILDRGRETSEGGGGEIWIVGGGRSDGMIKCWAIKDMRLT